MVEVLVERDPLPGQRKGDWIVRIGRGRGGKKASRHRQKKAAIKKARTEARKRADKGVGVTLYVQGKHGQPKKEADYEGGHRGGGGLLGRLGL